MGKLKWTASPLLLPFSFSSALFTALFYTSFAADTMDRVGMVRDGETLVSAGGRFELGFFRPGASANKYLCIRFIRSQERPIVWVANRQQPLNASDDGVVLRFGGGDGNLVVLDGGGDVVWSTARLASNASGSRVARLLDTGNLIVRGPDGGFIWQSFDEPGNTMLPGMRLLVNTKTGAGRGLTSWATADDPSPGNYSWELEVEKLPRIVLREGSSTIRLSTGLWNGIRFTSYQPMNANDFFNSSVVSSGDETYYTESMIGKSSLVRLLLDPSGNLQRLVWTEKTGVWSRMWTSPAECQRYAKCGHYATCAEPSFPYCRCLRGFQPKSPQEWSMGKGADGCVRATRLGCGGGDVFLLAQDVKLPELDNSSTVSMGMSLEECRDRCAKDCSCTAYATADAWRRGCITWSGPLVGLWNLTGSDQEFYLRLAASDLDPTVTSDFSKKRSKRLAIIASSSIVSGMVLLLLCGFWITKRKKKMHEIKTSGISKQRDNEMVHGEDMELRLFDFRNIISATNNFSITNKIGEGGFGIVYKGTMEDGQEVAVKRLSWTSVQGVGEFMNEAKLIVKLQHNNLVRLLGCCIQEDERMLVFEYMHNKSLDFFIFDEAKRGLLGWRIRLNIILGIARGLLYLHHDSRLKIIHRDLKAGNILLDGTMNPKISDFGTARIFGGDQHIEKTKRVIGTYGYMSPEYAINGIISIKSDVFSFGVLVLEILSGIRSQQFYETKPHLNLLPRVWNLWQEEKCMEILDPMDTSSCHKIELLRCMQIGLLCVQEHAVDRPTMREVVMMLGSENFPLTLPKKPGFVVFRSTHPTDTSSSIKHETFTINEMTITDILEGR